LLLHNFFKRIICTAVLSGFLIGGYTAANAAEGIGSFSANVGFFSQYSFRGIDQGGKEAAIQGGFDWAHESGFYIGTWASLYEWLYLPWCIC
jgi:uncharacterized protein (TIGR02001 family)